MISNRLFNGDNATVGRWLVVAGSILFAVYSFHRALYVNFESEVFAPFRFEAFLLASNAIKLHDPNLFVLNDWSTSPALIEHPLLYLHNLTGVHMLAGIIQCTLGDYLGSIALFAVSLLVSIVGLWFGIRCVLDLMPTGAGPLFRFGLLLLTLTVLLVHDRSLRLAPQNLLIATTSSFVLWNFSILLRAMKHTISIKRLIIELSTCIFFSSLAETNLALLLLLISGVTLVSDTIVNRDLDRKSLLSMGVVFFGASVALVIPRAFQLMVIWLSGNWSKFRWDAAYSYMIKTHSHVDVAQAVEAYRHHMLVYYGDSQMQTYSTNWHNMMAALSRMSGGLLSEWLVLLAGTLVIVAIIRGMPLFKKSCTLRAGIYVIAFFISSILMIFISGDALYKITYDDQGFLNYKIGYGIAMVLFAPIAIIEWKQWKGGKLPLIAWIVLPIFAIASFNVWKSNTYSDVSHHDHLDFLEAKQVLEPNAYVITNYEPSIVPFLFGRPVEISWFVMAQNPADLVNSQTMIKFWRVVRPDNGCPHYLFLAKYPPYGDGSWRDIMKRNGILDSNGSIQQGVRQLFGNANFRLFRLPLQPGMCPTSE